MIAEADVGNGEGTGTAKRASIVARWTDANNHLRLDAWRPNSSTVQIDLVKLVAGTPTTIGTGSKSAGTALARARLVLDVRASGAITAAFRSHTSSSITIDLATTDSAVATGGALDDGQGGIADISDATFSRFYDNITVSVPAPESIVIYPGRSLEITGSTILRQNAAGTQEGRPRSVRGGLAKLRPAGAANRTSRIVVRGFYVDAETGQPVGDFADLDVAMVYTPQVRLVPAPV
jgi:hypothetical protein